MKKLIPLLLLCSAVQAMAAETLTPPPYPGYNRVVIPKTVRGIALDGTLNPSNWDISAEVTGLIRYSTHGEVLPEEQRTSFHLMYDDQRLYFGMRSRNYPEGLPLKANIKDVKDDDGIVFMDHFEIQVSCTDDPGAALKKHFYKFIGNHLNSFVDQKQQPSVGQIGLEWDGGGEYLTRVSDASWDMELSTKFSNMDELTAPRDGETWIMWLVRAYNPGSAEFFMWNGHSCGWLNWNEMARMTFQSETVAAQLKKIGEPLRGNLDVEMKLVNTTKAAQTVYFNLNYDDQKTFDFSETVQLGVGESKSVTLKKDGLTNAKGTTATLTAWMDGGRGEQIFLYQQRFTLTPKDEQYITQNMKHVKEWRESKTDYLWKAAYFRSTDTVSGEINLDFDGVDPKIEKNATQWRQSLRGKVEGGKVAFTKTMPLVNRKAEMREKLDKRLPDGTWMMTSELLSAKGEVLDTRSYPIVVKAYEWEGNTIGISDEIVPPPYTPIQIENPAYLMLSVVNYIYSFDSLGLPIRILTKDWKENLLDGDGITLEVCINGQWQAVKNKSFSPTITDEKLGKISFTASAKVGDLNIHFDHALEYDGALTTTMRYGPEANGKVKIDGMRLRIPILDEANMMIPYRGLNYSGGGVMFDENAEDGTVLWESAQARPFPGITGSFNPTLYLGTPNRGLYWFCASDRGWVLDDKVSSTVVQKFANHITYEAIPEVEGITGTAVKCENAVEMQHYFVNTPTTLDKEREITFMIQAMPPKPLPANWRETTWGSQLIHCFGGWGDGYYNFSYEDPEDWKLFNKWGWHDKGVYVATELIGQMVPGTKTYMGEWTGNSDLGRVGIHTGLAKDYADLKWHSDMGKIYDDRWEERAAGYFLVHTAQSLVDCRVWCYDQGVRLGGLHGYWWDMGTMQAIYMPEVGLGYTREDGTKQAEFNYFYMRQMFKRMFQVAGENNVEPFQWHYVNGLLSSFLTGSWLVEGHYYMFSPDVDLISGAARNFWPIVSGKFTGILPQMTSNFHEVGYDYKLFGDPRPTRAAMALCLVNDFGGNGINDGYRDTILALMRREGFFDASVTSVTHWERKMRSNVRFSNSEGSDAMPAVYTLPGGKLMLVVGNVGEKEFKGNFAIRLGAFDERFQRDVQLRELEQPAVTATLHNRDGFYEIPSLFVAPHDFRIFILEL